LIAEDFQQILYQESNPMKEDAIYPSSLSGLFWIGMK